MPFTGPVSPSNPSAVPSAPTRRRPLVTYGKRKPAARETPPPPKKRRLSNPTKRAPSPVDETCIVVATSPPPPPTPPKSSILRYFRKVGSPSSGSDRTASPSSQHSPASTPSTSPVKVATPESRPRSRRRLTTRPLAFLDAADIRLDERPRSNVQADDASLTSGGESPRSATSEATDAGADSALKERSINRTKTVCSCSDKRCRHGRGSSKRGQKSPTSTVQMTLSLSTRNTTIKQCRECDMLYNPLHPSDVKHHARHHASVVKTNKAAG